LEYGSPKVRFQSRSFALISYSYAKRYFDRESDPRREKLSKNGGKKSRVRVPLTKNNPYGIAQGKRIKDGPTGGALQQRVRQRHHGQGGDIFVVN